MINLTSSELVSNSVLTPPRDYQQSAIDQADISLSAGERVVVVLPTGGGKTIVAQHLVARFLGRGLRILFVAHRHELINQAHRRIGQHDDVVIQTVQGFKHCGPIDLIITDECHHIPAASYQAIHEVYPDALQLGLTATPERADGKGLKRHYDRMVATTNVRRLTEAGHLAQMQAYVPEHQIMVNASKVGGSGDFTAKALKLSISDPSHASRAIAEYRKWADGLRGLVFCVDRGHAKQMATAYRDAGFKAVALDGSTKRKDRVAAFQDWATGRIDIICNCELFVEGLDLDGVDFVQCLRATRSIGLWLQMLGRAMRPTGRPAILLDHTDNAMRLGLPIDYDQYQLNDDCEPAMLRDPLAKQRKRDESGVLVETNRPFMTSELVLWGVKTAHATALLKAHPEWSDGKIAELAGMNGGSIWQLRKRLGIDNPNAVVKVTEVQRTHAVEILKTSPEWSNAKIAKLVGTSHTTISRLRRRLGVDNPNVLQTTSVQRAHAAEILKTSPEWSDAKIAKLVGTSKGPVRKLRKQLGIMNPNANVMAPDRLTYATELLNAVPVFNNRKIAKLVGVSPNAISRLRKKLTS